MKRKITDPKIKRAFKNDSFWAYFGGYEIKPIRKGFDAIEHYANFQDSLTEELVDEVFNRYQAEIQRRVECYLATDWHHKEKMLKKFGLSSKVKARWAVSVA